jgi:hypothetical protein
MNRRKNNIDKVNDAFAILAHKVSLSNSLNLQDINIHAENFFRDVLNYIFKDRKFKNLNYEYLNSEAIDLGDTINDMSFQISSDSSLRKVNETIEKYNKRKDYRQVIMLYC